MSLDDLPPFLAAQSLVQREAQQKGLKLPRTVLFVIVSLPKPKRTQTESLNAIKSPSNCPTIVALIFAPHAKAMVVVGAAANLILMCRSGLLFAKL
jgi:hypothetical protein